MPQFKILQIPMHQDITIPIIIINWNGISDTKECIESLELQSYKSFHIYLIDNDSSEDEKISLKNLYAEHPKVKLIMNNENLGFTRGTNRVLEKLLQEQYEYVVMLNNDTYAHTDWLKNLVSSAIDNNADIVSSKMIDYYDRTIMDNAGHYMLNTGELLSVGHQKPIENYNVSKQNFGACGGAALYSSSLLNAIGIFDEYFDTGYEDAELGLRAYLSGYKCMYQADAIVYHKMGQSIKKVFNYAFMLKMHKSIWYTYFKLIPISCIIFNIPSFILKYIMMLIVNIIFWKPQFIRLMFEPLYLIFRIDWSKIKKARRKFFSTHAKVRGYQLIPKQTFFLAFDFQRFLDIFVYKRRSFFEKYKT